MKKELLTLNSPNKNLRTYSSAAIQSAIDNLEGRDVPLFLGIDHSLGDFNLINCAGTVSELAIKKDVLLGKVIVIKDEYRALIEQASVRPAMEAKINEGVISDIVIKGFIITNDPA